MLEDVERAVEDEYVQVSSPSIHLRRYLFLFSLSLLFLSLFFPLPFVLSSSHHNTFSLSQLLFHCTFVYHCIISNNNHAMSGVLRTW